ncbi:LPS translocon maturation chaperone LptM [Salinimonas chungwhensis]|uniref:LPS translocon maturation chaperone LptM n=1 Tax=Salinimonas chungwhensis TaxID=265425 RepID=UPI0012E9AAE2|nr:lipoprotein [Salinimonas chungwhensis]
MQKTSRIIGLCALAALLLSACGYRGALYLPDEEAANQRTAPSATQNQQGETP